MGKLIRKRTFIGNISLVIFLAFLCTLTVGTTTFAAPANPSYDTKFEKVVDNTNPVMILDDQGWKKPGDTVSIFTDGGVTEQLGDATEFRFTIQVLTSDFNSIFIDIQNLVPGNLNVVSAVYRAAYDAVYGAVYNVYQLVYSYTDNQGFNPQLATWIKVYATGINAQQIDLDLEEPVPIKGGTPIDAGSVGGKVSIPSVPEMDKPYIVDNADGAKLILGSVLGTPDLVNNTVSTIALPETQLNASVAQVLIPRNTVISGPAGWTGTVNAPKVVVPTPVANETPRKAIEVGFGDVELTFDQPVKIVIPGEAGQRVKWVRGGISHEITNDLTGVAAGDIENAIKNEPAGAGKLDSGNDLVIWTMHFTQFVTYTVSSSSSSGGGGGVSQSYVTSTTGSAKVYPSAGGSIGLGNDATVKIPAKALKGSSQVEVKVQKVASPAAAPAGWKLVSGVYDFIVGGSHSYTFDKKVSVVLKFDPKLVAEGQIPAIFNRKDGANTWTKIGGKVSG